MSSVLIAGVNLYAMAIVLQALLGWPQWVAIVVAGFFVLAYITLGGLSSAIYNEVLQFFVILAALIPLTVVGLKRVGGWGGLSDSLTATHGEDFLSAWGGTGIGHANPLGANWLTIVLGLGFVMSFGYWTTNFAEVQRALSARNLSAARRTPLIAAFPKMFIPLVVVVPGLIATVMELALGKPGSSLSYNDAIPVLMRDLLPNGVLGVAVTGLLAAFMAGMAANVSAFNTVFTNDIWAAYAKRDREDAYYLRTGRVVTAVGVVAEHGDGLHRLLLLQHHELPADAVLVLQRPAVLRLHHRHVLEARHGRRGLLGAADRHGRRDDQLLLVLQAGRHRHPLRPGRQLRLLHRRLRGRRRGDGRGLALHHAQTRRVTGRFGLRDRLARHGRAARGGRRRLVPQPRAARLGRRDPRRRLLHPLLPLTLQHRKEPVVSEYEYQHEVEELERASATAARLFDVRRIIGGLFTLYGLVVTIAGLTASDADIKKAQGINLNLWTGVGMLALGLLFFLWLILRPTPPRRPPAQD
ncbi:hypothetical protein GCM10020000_48100 [Streptomyces olivoverticillatus]